MFRLFINKSQSRAFFALRQKPMCLAGAMLAPMLFMAPSITAAQSADCQKMFAEYREKSRMALKNCGMKLAPDTLNDLNSLAQRTQSACGGGVMAGAGASPGQSYAPNQPQQSAAGGGATPGIAGQLPSLATQVAPNLSAANIAGLGLLGALIDANEASKRQAEAQKQAAQQEQERQREEARRMCESIANQIKFVEDSRRKNMTSVNQAARDGAVEMFDSFVNVSASAARPAGTSAGGI